MKTLEIEGAAKLLHCSTDRVLTLIAKEGLPAAPDIGKGWLFVDVDLIEWVRSRYANKDKWQSTREKARRTSGSSSTSVVSRYAKALAQPTARQRAESRPAAG